MVHLSSVLAGAKPWRWRIQDYSGRKPLCGLLGFVSRSTLDRLRF